MASRAWCFTIQVADDDKAPVLPRWDEKEMRFMVCQLEKAPTTGKRHWQGYVYFERVKKLVTCKKIFGPAAHLEKARGTPEENLAYCSKSETRIEGPYQYGVLPKQGERNDVLMLKEAIKAGKSDLELLEEFPGLFLRYSKGIERMRFLYEEEKAKVYRRMEVSVLWGSTRTGKTWTATENYPNAFLLHASNPEWWDGYSGQTEVILDDYKSQLPLHRLLQLLDGHPCRLPVKGGFRWALYNVVVMTSNSHPSTWYPNASIKEKEALMARFTRGVCEFEDQPEMEMSPLSLPPAAVTSPRGSPMVRTLMAGTLNPIPVTTPASMRILRRAIEASDEGLDLPGNQLEVIDLTDQ